MAEYTFYPDANPETTSVDGSVMHYDMDGAAWGDLQGGEGVLAIDYDGVMRIEIQAGASSEWDIISRGIILFDISAEIPEGFTIASGKVRIYTGTYINEFTANAFAFGIYSSAPASNTVLVAGDFDSLGTTLLSVKKNYDDIVKDGWTEFSLNTIGIALINTALNSDGIVKLGIREANYDAANIEPTWEHNHAVYIRPYTSDEGVAYEYAPQLVLNTGAIAESYIWVEGTYLHYIDANKAERRQQGILSGATGIEPGYFWLEGTNLHYIDAAGSERFIPISDLMGFGGIGTTLFGGGI